MNENGGHSRIEDVFDVVFIENFLAVDDDFVTLDVDNFSCVLIYEILVPGLEDPGCELASDTFLQVCLVDLDFFCKVEDVEDVLVTFVADGAKKGSDRQFLFAVDVGIHDIVDVSCKLDPASFERDDTGRVKFRAVGMEALAEEDTGRTVQLRHDDTLGSVDDECSAGSHVRDSSQEHVLDHRVKIFVFRVCTVEFQLSLKRNAVSQTSVKAFLNRITGRVDEIVDELQHEVVACVRYWKYLLEHLEQTFATTVFCGGVKLEEILEGFDLHFEKIGIVQECFGSCE